MIIVKKNKIVLFLITIMFLMVLFSIGILKVLAVNGNGTGSGDEGNEPITPGCGYTLCEAINEPAIARLTLYYYDGSSRKKVSGTKEWYVSNWSESKIKSTYGAYWNAVQKDHPGKVYSDIKFDFGEYTEIERFIITGTTKKSGKTGTLLSKEVLKRFGVTQKQLNKPSCTTDKNSNGKHKNEYYYNEKGKKVPEEGSCYKKAGYRVIMEPIFTFQKGNSGIMLTTKQVASAIDSAKSPKTYYWWIRWKTHDGNVNNGAVGNSKTGLLYRMYTEFDDIDIKQGNPDEIWSDIYHSRSGVYKDLKSKNNGVGYYIFDPGSWLKNKGCDAFNADHYKTKTSGPNGENCCAEVEQKLKNPSKNKESIEAYLDEYDKLVEDMGIEIFDEPLTKDNIYEKWKLYTAQWCADDESKETQPELTCGVPGGETTQFGTVATSTDVAASDTSAGEESKFVVKNWTFCDIRCWETISLKFPKEIQETIIKGTKLVWPTQKNAAIVNAYPLIAEGTASCQFNIKDDLLRKAYCPEDEYGELDCRQDIIRQKRKDCIDNANNYIGKDATGLQKFYDLKGEFKVGFDDDEYGGTWDLVRYDDGYSTRNYEVTGTSVDKEKGTVIKKNGDQFKIKQKVQYKLRDDLYPYINNVDGTIKSSKTPISDNYINLGYGNMPVSYNAKNDKIYNYFILYSQIGGFNGKKKVKSEKRYYCQYSFHEPEADNSDCKCVEGPYVGKDLTQYMTGGAPGGGNYTCEEAREKYCSEPTVCLCPPGTLYADKNLTSQMSEGMSCSSAQESFCGGKCGEVDCPYPPDVPSKDNPKCPPSLSWYSSEYSIGNFANEEIVTQQCLDNPTCSALTCTVFACPPGKGDSSGRPLNALIAQYLANHPGKTLDKALLDYLVECSCGSAENIIFRVIDLKNPFPGKDAPAEGRRAGFNWSNPDIQAKYITRNRGVNDNEIYDESKVMYHFELTKSVIQKIRQYNSSSNNDYNDFKLECDKGMKNCRSEFVHNTTYGLKSGSCASASSPSAVGSCS